MAERLTVKDGLPAALKAIKALTARQVLVGIPDDTADRDDVPGEGPITTAALGYIHEFGAPEQNIPARPFLLPGIAAIKTKAAKTLGDGARKALAGDLEAPEQALIKTGLTAQLSVQNVINEGDFAPLAYSTIEDRARRGRKGAQAELDIRDQGYGPHDERARDDAGLAQSNENVRPLQDTGQLRNAITFVVVEK